MNGEVEERVFSLDDPRVLTRIRWYCRRYWDESMAVALKRAISEDTQRVIKMRRWKRLPITAFRC